MKLRQYQNDSVNELSKGFRAHLRQILCLPTGAGKTVTFSEITNRAVTKKKTQTLVLTDRIELFEQTFNALEDVILNSDDTENYFNAIRNNSIQVLNAASKEKDFNPHALLTVGMVETVKRRLMFGYEPELIIIDEAHKGNFTKILDRWPNARVIGATATPIGKHLVKYYQNIVQNIDIPELIDQGFLCPVVAWQMQDDFSDLEVKKSGDEYAGASLNAHYNKTKLYAGVVAEWKAKALGEQTIVFNVSIEHTIKQTEEFIAEGIAARYVTSETPKWERDQILAAFKRREFTVLNNCGILTTGYDEPSITCIIVNRATLSLALWLQMCGRGSRPYQGKTHFKVLDFGANHERHGRWDTARIWKLSEPKKRAEKPAPLKQCPKCEAMVFAQASACLHCGFDGWGVERGEGGKPLAEGVMVEVPATVPNHMVGRKIGDLEVDELVELQKLDRYKPAFIQRIVRSKGELAVMAYGEIMGYKPGWFTRQKEQLEDKKFTTFSNFTLR